MILFFKILAIYEAIAGLAMLWNWHLKNNKGLEGIPYLQCNNPIKLFSVVVGFFLYFLFPMHILEQYILRFYDEDCRKECLLGHDGHCVTCGCHTKSKMWSPLEKDSQARWGKIIWRKSKYQALRKKYPVKINITYGAV
jgi:hypothetical protein